MFNLRKRTKKIFAMGVAVFTGAVIVSSPAKAETPTEYLKAIADFTYATAYFTLANLNNWMMPDTSDATKNLQGNFTTLTNSIVANSTTQDGLQAGLIKSLMAPRALPQSPMQERLLLIPYPNDFTYQSILTPKQPYSANDPRLKQNPQPDLAYNYLRNVSGMNIIHQMPGYDVGGGR